MPSTFNFAVTKQAFVPRKKASKIPVGLKKHRASAPLRPSKYTVEPDKREGLVYAPVSDQIRTILGSIPDGHEHPHKFGTFKVRVNRISGFYIRLRKHGFKVSNVSNFRFRHAKALIEMWRQDGCSATEMYGQWSALLFWVSVLGKPNMLDPLKYSTGIYIKKPNQDDAASKSSRANSFKANGGSHV